MNWIVDRNNVERRVYVSSSLGDDANNGLSEEMPKLTISAGRSLIRHGHNDALLLRRGDTFGEIGQWKTSGAEGGYQIIGSYGEELTLPLVLANIGLITHGGGGAPPVLTNIAIVDLEFKPVDVTANNNDTNGIILLKQVNNCVIEGCKATGFGTNIVLQADAGVMHENMTVNRCIVTDSYRVGAITNGIYAVNCNGLNILENVFDHNGWNENVEGANATIFDHNCYTDVNNEQVVFEGNISANASSHGVQMRHGGSCDSNLFIDNSIDALVAGNGNNGNFTNNVVIGGKDIDAANPRGMGLWAENYDNGRELYVGNNIFTRNTEGNFPLAMILQNVENFILEDNDIWQYNGPISLQNSSNGIITNNRVTNPQTLIESFNSSFNSDSNKFASLNPISQWMEEDGSSIPFGQWRNLHNDSGSKKVRYVGYRKPNITLKNYMRYIHVPGEFLPRALSQNITNWDDRFTARAANAYLRLGFAHR